MKRTKRKWGEGCHSQRLQWASHEKNRSSPVAVKQRAPIERRHHLFVCRRREVTLHLRAHIGKEEEYR